jgi:hypothetical protein
MRRFNLEVIALALSALAIFTGWLFIAEWIFFKIVFWVRPLALLDTPSNRLDVKEWQVALKPNCWPG